MGAPACSTRTRTRARHSHARRATTHVQHCDSLAHAPQRWYCCRNAGQPVHAEGTRQAGRRGRRRSLGRRSLRERRERKRGASRAPHSTRRRAGAGRAPPPRSPSPPRGAAPLPGRRARAAGWPRPRPRQSPPAASNFRRARRTAPPRARRRAAPAARPRRRRAATTRRAARAQTAAPACQSGRTISGGPQCGGRRAGSPARACLIARPACSRQRKSRPYFLAMACGTTRHGPLARGSKGAPGSAESPLRVENIR